MAREIQLTDWSTAGNLSNRSSGVQIPRDICTRFRRYLCSTSCSWIINSHIPILVHAAPSWILEAMWRILKSWIPSFLQHAHQDTCCVIPKHNFPSNRHRAGMICSLGRQTTVTNISNYQTANNKKSVARVSVNLPWGQPQLFQLAHHFRGPAPCVLARASHAPH